MEKARDVADSEVEEMDVDPIDDSSTKSNPRVFNCDDYGEIEVPDALQAVATYDVNGPRLMITHIVNENFKSYAGVQTLGPFHKSFTAIVGPNGSGKSNVIDSMLFVFGYRANKIRSKKVSFLIHNSENHKDIDHCTVAVHFQKIIDTESDENDYTVVPNSKLVVSRTAFKDNSSAYYLDGRKATYKDVAALLRASGIDLDHNRFLILQLNRVKAVEKEKDDLEGPKNEAVEYLKLENSIVRHKNELYQKYISECAESEEKAAAEFNKVKEGMKVLTEKMDDIAAKKKEKGKEHCTLYKDYEWLVKQCEESKEKFSELEKQDIKYREDLKHAKARTKKLEKSLEPEKKKIYDLQQVPQQNEMLLADLQKKIEKLEEDKAKEEVNLKKVMTSLRHETKGLQEEKDRMEEQLLGLHKTLHEKQSLLQVTELELEICVSGQQNEELKLKDMRNNLEKDRTELDQLKITAAELEKKIPEVEKELLLANADATKAQEKEVELSEKVRSLIYKVEETRRVQETASSKRKVLAFLLQLKKTGKIQGIFGRLVRTEKKYKSTMSGGGKTVSKGLMGSTIMDNVDPEELAKVENMLKEARGEVEMLRANQMKLKESMQKNTKDLTDMRHNLQLAEMKIKALKEQMESLQIRIKEQEVKVRTSAPDKKQVDELQKKIAAYRKDYDEFAETTSKVEAEVKRLYKHIMDIGESKMQAAQSRVDAISHQIDEATRQITKTNVGIKTAERNLKKAEEKVQTLEEEMAENCKRIQELNQLLKDMEVEATQVLEKHQQAQVKVQAAEKCLENVKKMVAKLEEEENAVKKDTIEVHMQLEKCENILKETKAKIKHWRKELASLRLSAVEGEQGDQLPTFSAEQLEGVLTDEVQYKITVKEERLAQMKPNMAAIAEYKKKEELYLARVGELDQIVEVRDRQRKYHEELRKRRLDEFMTGFAVITGKLREMYQMITLGGNAELELVDSLDPFSEGIVFSVRPPNKSWKNISNLSGGEKTLSSLALVFALHHYKPTPLYVMDEIDAALDFKNVSIVAHYIKERTKNAQFIIISLRNNMFELADRLIGIYKTYNCTKSATINPHILHRALQESNEVSDSVSPS
ncbi:hypothetical protein C0Q70_21634 [Pomacea canaliculata]|uniref:Structural maintenance of chromosomes protein 4 n=1 Tax=Pomacea canaliculata TaxID=400727 RepID=A0A2T7ND43_POMCA|nr:hypothetical protein C0Q70_21634 [Pomacea canaliculata]